MKNIPFLFMALSAALSVVSGANSLAQSASSTLYQSGLGGSPVLHKAETTPDDDAVLATAPDHINLRFESPVRLVKLTLRNEKRDWVDIEFRYNPRPAANYSWDLPELADADYYIADWAILGDNDRLIRGSFSFAFGADAEAPSFHRAAEELLLQQRYGDPTIRYVAPPPTTIIIDRDPPQYDPPFTIDLEEQQRRRSRNQ